MHDHSQPTHTANCDSCEFVAEAHAHDDESAVNTLAEVLALHNQEEHNATTSPDEIKDAVRAKMQTL